jgi:hypothetical protein
VQQGLKPSCGAKLVQVGKSRQLHHQCCCSEPRELVKNNPRVWVMECDAIEL